MIAAIGTDGKPAPEISGAPKPVDDRLQQIVDAAYGLLTEGGLEGLTIRAVLNRTGLARRAFYERFAGKDDLVLAVFAHAIRLAADHYLAGVRDLRDPVERLRTVIRAIAIGTLTEDADSERHSRHGAALSREHLRLADSRPADLESALRPLIDLLAQLLAEGMAAGVVRPGSAPRLARLVYNLVSTTVHAEYLSQDGERADRARREALADDIWQFCCFGISPATGDV